MTPGLGDQCGFRDARPGDEAGVQRVIYQRFGFVEVKRELLTPRCDRAFALEL